MLPNERPLPEQTDRLQALQEVAPDTLRRNLSEILANLHQNCYNNSTPARLIAVTKTVSAKTIQSLQELGIEEIAENRAQVAVPKLQALSAPCRLHWIGRLQTNKVKYIIDKVCMLQTLDRLALAQEIERQAGARGIVLPALVEVNVAREPQKAGLDVSEVRGFLRQMKDFPSIRVCGLMTMMPLGAPEDALRAWFRQMRALFDQLRQEAVAGVELRELSMGMSQDYVIAAQEGATMVRVGTALYQSRATI